MFGGSLLLLFAPGGVSFSTDSLPTPRRNCAGAVVVVKAPTRLTMKVSGQYISVLPDGQQAIVKWSDGERDIDYPPGSYPGQCDTVLSANKQQLSSGASVDWDLHDLSESGNDIGHGPGEDNLGLEQCNTRLYSLLLRNWGAAEGSTGTLTVGGAALDEWTALLEAGAKFTLPPESLSAIVCESQNGFAVSEGNSLLKLESSGGPVVFGINYNSCSN